MVLLIILLLIVPRPGLNLATIPTSTPCSRALPHPRLPSFDDLRWASWRHHRRV